MAHRLSPLLTSLITRQEGVVSRRQLLASGLDDNDVEVLLRGPSLHPAARGVYRTTTGEPTWRQRVWIATLRYAPAAAAGRTCLALAGLVPEPRLVEAAISAERRVGGEPGIVVRRSRDFARQAVLDAHPPRLRLEPAVLDVIAATSDERQRVALLGEVVRSRRTTTQRLRAELETRARFPGRRLLEALLDDVTDGVQSVLEHRYLRDVERAHGLPRARRQVRVQHGGTTIYRDADYLGGRLVVELDGRQGHEATHDRWADAERDLTTLLGGGRTVRITFGQVLEPCRTAVLVARLLVELGWRGQPSPCSAACAVGATTWRVTG